MQANDIHCKALEILTTAYAAEAYFAGDREAELAASEQAEAFCSVWHNVAHAVALTFSAANDYRTFFVMLTSLEHESILLTSWLQAASQGIDPSEVPPQYLRYAIPPTSASVKGFVTGLSAVDQIYKSCLAADTTQTHWRAWEELQAWLVAAKSLVSTLGQVVSTD